MRARTGSVVAVVGLLAGVGAAGLGFEEHSRDPTGYFVGFVVVLVALAVVAAVVPVHDEVEVPLAVTAGAGLSLPPAFMMEMARTFSLFAEAPPFSAWRWLGWAALGTLVAAPTLYGAACAGRAVRRRRNGAA